MTITRTSHDGFVLPAIGFGTYKLWGANGVDVVGDAIDNGYTLIDSAVNYENEGAVGAAVRAASVPRDELIVTSKLPGRHHAYDQAVRTIEESVYRTGLDHIDLYLIHWPNPVTGLYVEAWTALIEAQKRGLVRAIGVSNFLPEHLLRLEKETGVMPAVNQIELHPYFPQEEQVAFDREHGIITEAWSPLGRAGAVLNEPVVAEIAQAHGVDAGQIVLAWGVARGIVPIPKASSPERQAGNLAAAGIVLTDAEVDRITALGRPDGRIADQDPAVYEEF